MIPTDNMIVQLALTATVVVLFVKDFVREDMCTYPPPAPPTPLTHTTLPVTKVVCFNIGCVAILMAVR